MNDGTTKCERVETAGGNSATDDKAVRGNVFGKHVCYDGDSTTGDHADGAQAHGAIQELENENGTRLRGREIGIKEASTGIERFKVTGKTKHDGFGQGTLMSDLMWLWHRGAKINEK